MSFVFINAYIQDKHCKYVLLLQYSAFLARHGKITSKTSSFPKTLMKKRINGDNTGVVGRSGTIEAVAGSSLDVHGGLEWQTWACEL